MSQTKAQLISDLVQALNFTGTSSAPANGMYLSAANTIKLATNSNGRLTIDSSGNAVFTGTCTATTFIGALTGTASGNAVLTGSTNNQLVTVTSANAITGESTLLWSGNALSTYRDNATTYGPGILGHHQRGTIASPSVSQTNDTILNIVAKAFDGTDYHDAARIDFIVGAGTPGNNDMPGSIVFKTTDDGTGSSVTRATIQQNGNLLLDSTCSLVIHDGILHNGDTNTQIRFPANDTFTVETAGIERFRIDSGGNIGIGTTSPQRNLHIHQPSATSAYLHMTNDTTGAATTDGFSLYVATDGQTYYRARETTGTHRFYTSTTERLHIDSSGRILIADAATATNTPMETFSSAILQLATSGGASIVLGRNDSSVAVDNGIGNIYFDGNAASGGAWNDVARISCAADGAHADGDYPTRLTFSTTADGAATVSERLRIDSNGRVLLGTQKSFSGQSYYDDITINNSNTASGAAGGTGISLISGNNTWGAIQFGDSDDDDIGYIKYSHPGDFMRFATGGSIRFRIDSDGIKFNGDTAAANGLDDYEEGSWTALVMAGSQNISINNVAAKYTKIGNKVTCWFNITRNETGSRSGTVLWNSSLPFTSASPIGILACGTWWLDEGGPSSGDSVGGALYIYNGSTQGAFVHPTSPGQQGTNRYLQYSEWSQNRPIYGSFTYFI
jgi:hypothetical protein